VAAPGPGGGQPSRRALADQVAFELGQSGKHVKDELAARRGRVDRFLQAPEADPALSQASDGVDQMPQ
jgi:enoyl-CoA hydratase/carnithine racemase